MQSITNEELKLRVRELEKEVEKLQSKIKKQKYGLVWLDVKEGFEKASENSIPILEEIKDKAVINHDGKPTHIIIEGDNYHALTCLNYTHRGKIDVIYIDPPYNTGKEFSYKDARFLKEFPDGTAVPPNHPYRHSYWLSFMNKRLELAKNLLSDRGVLLISIDDNEYANLKLLCDKIFIEKNCLCTFFRKTKSMTGDDGNGLNIQHDYVLVYVKAKDNFMFSGEEKNFSAYNNPDNDEHGPWCLADPSAKSGGPSTYFPIKNPYTNLEDYPPRGRFWAFSKDTLKEYIKIGRIKFKREYSKKERGFIFKRYRDKLKTQNNAVGSLTFVDNIYMNQVATTELNNIMGNNVFPYPKPTIFLQKLLKYSSNTNSIILDFFAGSGTTMHATMKLNDEDGGHRQCILVQQNEGDNRICENITYERNHKAIKGYENTTGELEKGLGNSLRYYRTAFVGKHLPKEATDTDKVILSQKASCLLAIGENTLDEIGRTDFYQLFTDGNQLTCIYFQEDISKLDEFIDKIKSVVKTKNITRSVIYIFSWSTGEEFSSLFGDIEGTDIKPIPQPIIEIYKSINQ